MTAARGFGPADALLLVSLSLMWGLSFLFIEVALRDLGPVWVVGGRTLVGGAVLVVLLHVRGRRLPTSPALWGHLLLLGTINNAVPWTSIAWAQQTLPSGLTALLMALVPLSTVLVASAVGLEQLTRLRLVGLLLALGGVASIVLADLGQPGRVLAALAAVAATVMYASGAVYAKTFLSDRAPPLVLATGQVVSATIVVVPSAWLLEGPLPPIDSLATDTLVSIGLLGGMGTGIAFLVFYTLIARVGATNATMTTYLVPLVAIVAGVLVLGERLGPFALVGGAMIVTGIWLAQRGTRAGPRQPVREPMA